jgi:hypothetical protein
MTHGILKSGAVMSYFVFLGLPTGNAVSLSADSCPFTLYDGEIQLQLHVIFLAWWNGTIRRNECQWKRLLSRSSPGFSHLFL